MEKKNWERKGEFGPWRKRISNENPSSSGLVGCFHSFDSLFFVCLFPLSFILIRSKNSSLQCQPSFWMVFVWCMHYTLYALSTKDMCARKFHEFDSICSRNDWPMPNIWHFSSVTIFIRISWIHSNRSIFIQIKKEHRIKNAMVGKLDRHTIENAYIMALNRKQKRIWSNFRLFSHR